MRFLDQLRRIFIEFKYSKLFAYVGCIFALIYHSLFLIIFRVLKVYPMFYFNIFSVSLFTILLFFCSRRSKFFIWFTLFYSEVVIHQILADYFLGGEALFHFFILMVGFLPLFCFREKFFLAYIFGIFSAMLFIVIEIISPKITGVYNLSETAITIIKTINVSSSTLVIISCIFVFSFIVYHMQFHLESVAAIKGYEAEMQAKKVMTIQNHIINSLASLVDNRDIDTGEHIQRTCAYVELIAKEALKEGVYSGVIDDDFVDLIKRAAPLHDIGKIVVSDLILKKPGKLTTEEFEEMKKHTTEGGRIINEVIGISEDREFIKIAEQVAMCHHEKWNGTGYPQGLKKNQIPVSARIMAVADVFDALVSKRCYKEPMPKEKALEIIKESSGEHFDPEIVRLFFNVIPEVIMVMEKWSK